MKRLFKSKATEPTPYPINHLPSAQFAPTSPPVHALPAPYPPPSTSNGTRRQDHGPVNSFQPYSPPVEYHPQPATSQHFPQAQSPNHLAAPDGATPGQIPPASRRRDKILRNDNKQSYQNHQDGATPFPSDVSQEADSRGLPEEYQFGIGRGHGGAGKQRRSRDMVAEIGRGQPTAVSNGVENEIEMPVGTGEIKRRVSLRGRGEGLFGNWGRDRKEKQNEKEKERDRERAARQAGVGSPVPGQGHGQDLHPRYALQDQSQSSSDLPPQGQPYAYQDERGRSPLQSGTHYLEGVSPNPHSYPYLSRSPPQMTPSPDLPNPFAAPPHPPPRIDFYDNHRAASSAESYAQLAPATPPASSKPSIPPNGMASIRLYPPPLIKGDSGTWSPNSSDDFHSHQMGSQQVQQQQQQQQQRAVQPYQAQDASSPGMDAAYLATSPPHASPGQLFLGSHGAPLDGTSGQRQTVMADSHGQEVQNDARLDGQAPNVQARNVPFLQPRKAPPPPAPPALALSRSPNNALNGDAHQQISTSPPAPPRLSSADGISPRPSYDLERSLNAVVPNKLQRLRSPNPLPGGKTEGETGQKEKKGFLGFGGGAKHKDKEVPRQRFGQSPYEEFDPITGEGIAPVRSKEALKGEKQRTKALEKQLSSNNAAVDSVTTAITTLCGRAFGSDLPDITTLLQRIDTSAEDVAKEAARAVRKEIKYGRTDAERVFATKVWMLGCLNFSSKSNFRAHTTDKKFLASFQQVLADPPGGAGLSNDAFERLRDTLAHLNFSLGAERGCEGLRETWLKVKTAEEPTEGFPFPPTHPVFSPLDRLLRRPSDGSSRDLHQGPHVSAGDAREPHLSKESSMARLIPDESQELRRLLRECSAAQEHAAVLNNALVYATPQTMHAEPVIQEFYAICVRDQESLVSQMGWANSKAEISRMERGIDTPAALRQSFEHDSGNRLSNDMPLPEEAFDELLKANHQITEVLKIHEDLESMARSEQELDMVKAKSKAETRGNRNLDVSGYSGGSAGGSMSATPARVPSPQPYRTNARGELRPQPGARLEPFQSAQQPRGLPSGPGFPPLARTVTPEPLDPPRRPEDVSRAGSPTRKLHGPRPLSGLRRNAHGSDSSLNGSIGAPKQAGGHRLLSDLADYGSDTDEDLNMAPVRPSAKALGKRRIVEREDEPNTFDPDDMWKTGDRLSETSASSSEEDLLHPLYVHKKPIQYIYDAAVDREDQRKAQRQSRRNGSSSQSMSVVMSRVPGEGASSNAFVDDFGEPTTGEPEEVLVMPGAGMDAGMQYVGDGTVRPSGLKHAQSGRWKPWKRS